MDEFKFFNSEWKCLYVNNMHVLPKICLSFSDANSFGEYVQTKMVLSGNEYHCKDRLCKAIRLNSQLITIIYFYIKSTLYNLVCRVKLMHVPFDASKGSKCETSKRKRKELRHSYIYFLITTIET